jgi:hypothetical protein
VNRRSPHVQAREEANDSNRRGPAVAQMELLRAPNVSGLSLAVLADLFKIEKNLGLSSEIRLYECD